MTGQAPTAGTSAGPAADSAVDDEQLVVRTVVNQIAAARGFPEPWPGTTARLPDWLRTRIAEQDISAWGAQELGHLRERLATQDQRNAAGIWYTPPDVAAGMTRFALDIDSCRTDCTTPGCALRVLALDPSCGAGVFLLEAARQIAHRYAVRATGQDPAPAWAVQAVMPTVMTECVYGIDTDPVAVDLARAACWLEVAGLRPITFMDANIAVGDPLAGDSPKALEDRMDDPDPLIIIGNPPYRDRAAGSAPWIEARRAGADELVPRPSLDEFRPDNSRLAHKLANLWAYFWRWAAWKALESRNAPGTVALLTPSAYIGSDAYGQMRGHLRRVSREGWVVNVSPEGHRPPADSRLFPDVQIPLAIGVFTTHQRSGEDGS